MNKMFNIFANPKLDLNILNFSDQTHKAINGRQKGVKLYNLTAAITYESKLAYNQIR